MTDPQSPPPASRPLEGLVVVELGHSVAAPYAGQILADLGARVLKVENPAKGDDARSWGPPFWNGASTIFQSVNRNKQSVAIDLKDEAQCAALRRFILEEADIVVQNMRAGLVGTFGIDAESLRAQKPQLVYCNLGAFGTAGPNVGKPGYDPLMQAFGGIMSVTGHEGDEHVRVGVSLIDQGAGMWAVIGILAALYRRQATGEGCTVDTSLFETALAWISAQSASCLATGVAPKRRGSENPGLVPYRVFETADAPVMIAAGNDNLFRRLSAALGHPEWAQDERFATNPARVAGKDEVTRMLQDVLKTKPQAHWIAALEAAAVPVSPIQSIDQVVSHPQTLALDMLQQAPDADIRLMGSAVMFDGVRPPLRNAPPPLGSHTAAVLGRGKAGR